MSWRRPRVTVALLVLGAVTLGALLIASGALPGIVSDDGERPDDPSTTDTVGYVEGYWYDDELAVDDGDDAVVEDDDLEAVIYRSMARVEELRELPFEEEVPVEVITREEFQAENDELFADLEADGEIKANAVYEALFVADRETDAVAEQEAMYDGTVAGYYEPEEDRIVVVADDTESPELDEIVLGHELVHALQDQQFDLTRYDRETIDQDNAKNGIVEGDAVRIERAYEERCGEAWSCLPAAESDPASLSEINAGIYLTTFQPYSDGPDYVDHLYADDGWDAVDAAYEEPPASSSEVIRPGEDRDPAPIEVDDSSSEEWRQLEVDGEVATETVGEAGMVAAFGADALEAPQFEAAVLDADDITERGTQGFDYDHPYTDGWAGDELVTYVTDDATAADDPAGAIDHAGFVWETEWTSETDAREFATGYLELLEFHDAAPVDDRRDTYEIDDGYEGAYYLDRDGETVTVVRAPSVDDLADVAAGAAPTGEDDLERVDAVGDGETDDGADDAADDAADDDPVAGFGAPVAVVALSVASLSVALVRVRSRDARARAN